ncbi:hypothetical protein [Haladaptatus sp. DFWS20]|uniref:hypothetical protein n=1 Tax=Haladaptatus sp. DFWS20 TaxID=3403467 RepID=UPI003EBF35FC
MGFGGDARALFSRGLLFTLAYSPRSFDSVSDVPETLSPQPDLLAAVDEDTAAADSPGTASETADLTDHGKQDVFVTTFWSPRSQEQRINERYECLNRLLEHVIHSSQTEENTLLVGQSSGELTNRADELGVRHGGMEMGCGRGRFRQRQGS